MKRRIPSAGFYFAASMVLLAVLLGWGVHRWMIQGGQQGCYYVVRQGHQVWRVEDLEFTVEGVDFFHEGRHVWVSGTYTVTEQCPCMVCGERPSDPPGSMRCAQCRIQAYAENDP